MLLSERVPGERERIGPVDQLGRRRFEHGCRVRIPIRQQAEIRIRLGAVAKTRGPEVAETLRHPSAHEGVPPSEERDHDRDPAQSSAENERRDGKEGAKEDLPATLASRWVDLDVDAVRAGTA